jgi:putative ABC transport system permease protein
VFITALKGVAAHRARLLMTALAIVLGVAFVSGTFVFTDTINARFENLFSDVYAGVDASVRPETPEFGGQPGQNPGSFDESLLTEVANVDGVAVAEGSVGGFAQIIAPNGDPIGGQGPPTLGFTWIDTTSLSSVNVADGNGRAPAAAGEVVIDVATAESNALHVGDEVGIQTIGGTETFEIVGLANFGTEDNLAGASLSIFTLDEGQRLFDLEGQLTSIDVLGLDEVEPEALVDAIAPLLPEGAEVVTGDQQTQEQLDSVTEGLGFLNTALLAFAGVAVFVGAFVIQNTFRIVVAQRIRELALFRAVGATGRQLVSLVTMEALIVGTAASIVGVMAGIGVATGIKAAMNAGGFGLPDGPLTVEPRTIAVGLAVGIIVTLVSALLPARKAATVPPVAAMSEAAAPVGGRSLRRRSIGGAITAAAGGASLAVGLVLENGASLTLVALGSLSIFVGVSVLAPVFAIPIAKVLGRPLPGITGDLARENTIRQPRRTASTAAALMIGVALVSFVSIFAASIKATVSDTLEGAFPADLAFQSTNFTVGVTPELETNLEALDEFDVVSAVRTGFIRIDGEELNVAAVDRDVDAVYDMEPSIEVSSLDSGLLVAETVLDERGWAVGDTVDVEYAATGVVSTEIAGTFEDQTFANYIISLETYQAHFPTDQIALTFASLADGVEIESGQAAAAEVLAAFPNLDMNTASEQIAEAEAQVDQLVALFSGLLGLAVVIAVIGIANTLSLSIVERTREIGLLRAVGLTRRQTRRMVRWEAIIVAVFGALLGVLVGSGLGWATVFSLADDGLGTFALPVGQLAIWLALAAVAGVIAAAGPARTAAKMNVLEAISHE